MPQTSAVTAYSPGTAEIAPPSFFGKLTDLDESNRLLAPLRQELGALDLALQRDLRVRDLTWVDGKGTLRAVLWP